MKYPTRFFGLSGILLIFLLCSCQQKTSHEKTEYPNNLAFDTNHLVVPANYDRLRGQLLYMPVYSSVPYQEEGRGYQLSAFLSIHNTDFQYPISVTKVLYFHTNGKLIKNYLPVPLKLNPLQTMDYFVPESDTSGFGANFIVEWVSDSLVSNPLIETVMIGITNGQGISFLSQGRVLGIIK
ncbi:MAG: DUF3124 domain-containing protein [Bacteroidales bacterium]